MSRLYKIEDLVKEVLTDEPSTRDDDFKLILEVYLRINPSIAGNSFPAVMLGHNRYRLPSLESITRARRKLQAQHGELKASKEVEEERLNQINNYINYAIDGYSSNFQKFVDSQD